MFILSLPWVLVSVFATMSCMWEGRKTHVTSFTGDRIEEGAAVDQRMEMEDWFRPDVTAV